MELRQIQEFERVLDERDRAIHDRLNQVLASQQQRWDDGQIEHKNRFVSWIRNPSDSLRMNELHEIEKRLREQKTVTIGSNADGGFGVPEIIAAEIERFELLFSPVRRRVKVTNVASSDYKELVDVRGSTASWIGESGNRTATLTPQLREVAPTFGELYAYPQASEWSLDDVQFDVAAWLAESAAEQFALAESLAVISGDGSDKPTGMLQNTPEEIDDFASPLRTAAAYEFIACLTSQSPAVAEIRADCLIDLIYALNPAYRANAVWIMNSNTAAAVRKLKDADGNYLWQPGLQAGQPDRLLGYMVETWEQMPDIGTNNFPIGFGDLRRAYVLADRVGLRVMRDQVTTPGFVKFYIRRRVGGIVRNNNALKFLRTTIG